MPQIPSDYRAPRYLFNGHIQTIIPNSFRRVPDFAYQRERIDTPDGDFLDLDWLSKKGDRLVIISHGLEGNSDRVYVRGAAWHFHQHDWDVLAWNCRSCSGEMNRKPRFYHHGDTPDLSTVLHHAIAKGYQQVLLLGYSMGGSMLLKYLGEQGDAAPEQVIGGIAFSVPCNLGSSAREIEKPGKKFYGERFLKKLREKIRAKSEQFPESLSAEGIDAIKEFKTFDNRYTAPLHGFADADDFYTQASCGPWLEKISRPTLLVNALNDPFLPEPCYPWDVADQNPHLFFEVPRTGGHVGFTLRGNKTSWMDIRALAFAEKLVKNGEL